MKYAAFISYRHGGLDALVAKELHRRLEGFRIPKAIAEKFGGKSIGRVFQDKEELPTSSNLSASIDAALRASQYLILICSKRACESKWVLKEVNTFVAWYGRDRVIVLLIEGEPEEVLPDILRYREVEGSLVGVEPLAADIRADSAAASLKKLKLEILRILAPILGCSFDDLRQRHREQRIRRMAAVAALVIGALTCFGASSFYQFLQVKEQMWEKLASQSLTLAEYAESAFGAGDPITAALLAQAALPSDPENPDRPYVEAAEFALVKALRLYDYQAGFAPHRLLSIPSYAANLAVSRDEKYLAVACANRKIYVFRLEDGKLRLKLDCAASTVAKRNMVFLPDDRTLLYTAPEGLLAIDVNTGETLWRAQAASAVAASRDTVVAAAFDDGRDTGRFIFYRTADGQKIAELPTGARGGCRSFALNEDGRLLAADFLKQEQLALFDRISGAETLLADHVRVESCVFRDDSAYLAYAGRSGRGYTGALYELGTGERFVLPLSSKPYLMKFDGARCFYANGSDLRTIDWERQQTEDVFSFPADIATFSVRGGYAFVSCEDGSVHILGLSRKKIIKTVAGNHIVYNQFAAGQRYFVSAGIYSNGVVIYKRQERTPRQRFAVPAMPQRAIYDGDGARLLVGLKDECRIYDAATAQLLRSFACDGGSAGFSAAQGNAVMRRGNRLEIYDSAYELLAAYAFDARTQPVIFASAAYLLRDGELVTIDPESGREADSVPVENCDKAWMEGGFIFSQNRARGDLTITAPDGGAALAFDGAALVCVGEAAGETLAAVARGDAVEVYAPATRRKVFSLETENGLVYYGKFFDGGRKLALGWLDRAMIYDVSTGGEIADLSYQDGMLTDFFLDPVSGRIVTKYLIASVTKRAVVQNFAILRDPENYNATAWIDQFINLTPDGAILLYDQNASLLKAPLYKREEIYRQMRELLNGEALTEKQRIRYHL